MLAIARPDRRVLGPVVMTDVLFLVAFEVVRPDVDLRRLRIAFHVGELVPVGREVRLHDELRRLADGLRDFALPVVERELAQLGRRHGDHEPFAVARDRGRAWKRRDRGVGLEQNMRLFELDGRRRAHGDGHDALVRGHEVELFAVLAPRGHAEPALLGYLPWAAVVRSRDERPDIHLILSRFVRDVCDQATVGRQPLGLDLLRATKDLGDLRLAPAIELQGGHDAASEVALAEAQDPTV